MPIVDWFRKRRRGRSAVELALPPLEAALAMRAPRLENAVVEPELVRARLADGYRDAQVAPVPPKTFDRLTAGLDAEAWRRLALVVGLVDQPAVRDALARLAAEVGAVRQVEEAFVGLARATPLLTMELFRQGPLRVEEFARHFLARLGALVAGETVAQSRERLERLDYESLLAEAERARESAEGRMNYLRRLQEEQDQRRPRRGKW
jgi:hypothetical protein